MIIKKLTYLGLALCVAVLSGCRDDVTAPDTLNGDGTKTPLSVTALLDINDNASQTRAANKDFVSGDQMVFYLRHVKWNGGFTTDAEDERDSKTADQAPRLINLTCTGSEAWNKTITDILPFDAVDIEINSGNTKQAAGLQASYTNTSSTTTNGLYWDDFSDASSTETDLHEEGHYLQSYYGYCYNGGTPTTALVEGTGVIGWKVQTNQTSADDFMHSDLLWSPEQEPVKYQHLDANADANRPGFIIPYTHAMSKVTINVIAGDGFATDYDFATTSIKLDKVRVSCSATAHNASLDYSASTKEVVTMQPGELGTTAEGNSTRAFQAIIVPSVLSEGNTLATIFNMDGNKYDIPVTSTILTSWSSQLTETDEEVHNGTAQAKPLTRSDDQTIGKGKGYEMKSGVNYVLNVTVNKTEVTVSAMILDWNEVTAEGEGEIFFEHDIKDKPGQDGIAEALKTNGFDVYKSTTATFGTKATSLRWNRTAEKWKYNPTIYWLGGQNEYFRALSNVKTDAVGTPANESLAMENGRDHLWGTTPADDGKYDDNTTYTFAEGDPLPPRTGKVPLLFYHAMAKISINLKDILADVQGADPASLLDLRGATIQLTNLATGGTIELDKGKITPSATEDKTFSEDRGAIPSRMGFFAAKENGEDTYYNANVTVRDYCIIPQEIGNDALLIVTLANGTTYKAQLNLCQTQNSHTAVNKWERNKHYIYDITLAKDQIMFRAEIKDWDKVDVSGIITPEW